ncbi:UNVERIFIED_CONTAM: hypothetical protein FKN15_075456 [Acipenser sinensis]
MLYQTSGSRVSREHQLNARPLFPRVHEYYEAGLEFREVGVNPCTRAAYTPLEAAPSRWTGLWSRV